MYHFVEKNIHTSIHNGNFQEEILDKENKNGKITVQKKRVEGIIDKGKLRKKKVFFSPKIEYIKPGFELYECNQKISPQMIPLYAKQKSHKSEAEGSPSEGMESQGFALFSQNIKKRKTRKNKKHRYMNRSIKNNKIK